MEEGILCPFTYLHFFHNDAKAMIEALSGKHHKMSCLWEGGILGLSGLAYI